ALCRRINGSGKFVTLFYLILDPATGIGRYAVAGHNPPFLCGSADDRSFPLQSPGGFPLGLFPNSDYGEATIEMQQGDTLLLYSDGLTEAHDPENRIYGEERVTDILRDECKKDLTALVDAIRHDVEAHMNGREIFDDLTLVGIRYAHAVPSELQTV